MTTDMPQNPDPAALLRLLQLVSPALPVGAFAYSQSLEPAVNASWITDEPTARDWIGGLLDHTLASLDLPLVARLHAAWTVDDESSMLAWSRFLAASRTTLELRTEDRQLGANLARLLDNLGVAGARRWIASADVTYAAMFALAVVRWQIPLQTALHGFAFAWLEAQTSAAVRLVPLGQSAGQRILLELGARVPAVVARSITLADDDLGAAAPAHAIASAHHETQYSRLFRS
jgi:urease accessory protein